ncbi:MAG: hypothetical protein ACE5QV_07465 [Fidelibacterota bacterium]
MKDLISVMINPQQITIQYESIYLGQIAPHIRNMIDTNTDLILTEEEVNNFFAYYKKSINETFKNLPLFIGAKPFTIELVEIMAPTILTDTLLAPFKIQMIFTVTDLRIEEGVHELVIDPKLFFINGNQFIQMAKERLNFTDEQERAIGHFQEMRIFASESINFISSYPGYIRKGKKAIFIYGIFYDETIIRIEKSQYPKIRIKLELTSK